MNFYEQLALSATDKISSDLNSVPGPAVDWKEDREETEKRHRLRNDPLSICRFLCGIVPSRAPSLLPS